jgi:hypothetical protein
LWRLLFWVRFDLQLFSFVSGAVSRLHAQRTRRARIDLFVTGAVADQALWSAKLSGP